MTQQQQGWESLGSRVGSAVGAPASREYEVRWEIPLNAMSPEAAAEIAREIQQDPDNLATVYQVREFGVPGAPWLSIEVRESGGAVLVPAREPAPASRVAPGPAVLALGEWETRMRAVMEGEGSRLEYRSATSPGLLLGLVVNEGVGVYWAYISWNGAAWRAQGKRQCFRTLKGATGWLERTLVARGCRAGVWNRNAYAAAGDYVSEAAPARREWDFG